MAECWLGLGALGDLQLNWNSDCGYYKEPLFPAIPSSFPVIFFLSANLPRHPL
jgi:hypothetical protein